MLEHALLSLRLLRRFCRHTPPSLQHALLSRRLLRRGARCLSSVRERVVRLFERVFRLLDALVILGTILDKCSGEP